MAVSTTLAVRRFGLGGAPGEAAMAERDPAAWLWRQTEQPSRPPDPARMAGIMRAFQTATAARQRADRQQMMKAYFQSIRPKLRQTLDAAFIQNARSATPFVERLVWFWANHFTISAKGKSRVLPFVETYVDDAIRPHTLGRFPDMLVAVAQHPAMLIYLDNAMSIGPNSQAGKRNSRDLNENLAREILELHTVGVNGGYTQQDVIQLAKLLTGWTVPLGPRAPRTDAGFLFVRRQHEPGGKSVMGRAYPAGRQAGEQALRDLALRPETATFLAQKLTRHFLADDPPPTAVKHVARRYLDSGGDLRRTAQALIEAADIPAVGAARKFAAPMDHLAAAVRGFGPAGVGPLGAQATLAGFGQAPFLADSPAGYPDLAADWATPDSLTRRLEWAVATADMAPIDSHPLAQAQAIFGADISKRTANVIANAESPTEGLALLLAAPEFLWR